MRIQIGETSFIDIDDENKNFIIVRKYKKEIKTILVDVENYMVKII